VCPRHRRRSRLQQDARGSQTTRQSSVIFPDDPITRGGLFTLYIYNNIYYTVCYIYKCRE